jgi:hypothetical protein
MITLDVYSPSLSLSVRSLEDLSFYSIPAVPKSWSITPTLLLQLNLLAGQLYIQNYGEYASLCSFLELCFRSPDDGMEVGSSIRRPALSRSLTLAWSRFVSLVHSRGARLILLNV